ncbi:oligopeptide transporter, putative [Ricinus communis]|uniref:Oligopeptide transporter, putative n=1 Tax=Ricinus communis TaxID=3988 RepID=B9S733_RICCO|nr:oligopeptide transporter, putative [Ricinus communis]
MAIASIISESTAEAQTPLLYDVVEGSVDYKAGAVFRYNSGGWRSASLIIASNLITYLTGPLGQSTAFAAENVNAWSGTASLLPLLGASIADTFLGRYRTIIVASLIYILGLGLLTLSAVLPSLSDCPSTKSTASCSPNPIQVVLFFSSLYLVALGQGGHKPCVQAFGADQFDGQDPKECKGKSSFFNWWYFCMCGGTLITLWVLNYIQDNLNWGLGFGIPCVMMMIALIIFLLGTKTYRYSVKVEERSAFRRIGRVFLATIRNWQTSSSAIALEEEIRGTLPHQSSEQFKFLNKALLAPDGSKEDGKVCSLSEVEEAKAVLRLVPIWAACLVYAVVFLVSAIEKATGGEGHYSWFANNLNRGHLDYFYWLLAGLSMVQLVAYLYFARNYVYNR